MKYGKEIVISRGPAIELSVLANVGVAVVKFDALEGKVNVLSSAVMEELDAVLDELAARKHVDLRSRSINGVVFCSGKSDSFIVGADIKEIEMAQTLPAEVAFEGSQKGKAILAKLEALPMLTVAAIHGRCLGGGTELALACNERVLSDSKSTVIGLPEVALGVLPGWGGTVRAPKLVGFTAALPLVLNPMKPWSARTAWSRGLVTEVVPEQALFERAVCLALGMEPHASASTVAGRALRAVGDSSIGRALSSQAMKLAIQLQTGGKYPAPLAALKVMNSAFELPLAEARELESSTFAELCHTPACAECVQKFFERKNKRPAADKA